nr:MAG TPA: hypothetical protein [Caudoviricetes sp.]
MDVWLSRVFGDRLSQNNSLQVDMLAGCIQMQIAFLLSYTQ